MCLYASFHQFCDKLFKKHPYLCLWASAAHHRHRPECLQLECLTVPLRSAKVVVHEVAKAEEIQTGCVLQYENLTDVPDPTVGPQVKHLWHKGQEGHAEDRPDNCWQCGVDIAQTLNALLRGKVLF